MSSADSYFAWLDQLQCPKTVCSNRVQKILANGKCGYLWYHLSTTIHPTKEVSEVKKNVLLYSLKTNSSVSAIESMDKLRKLQLQRKNLTEQIKALENNIAKNEFVNRQAVQQHRKNVDTSQKFSIQNNIFKAKSDEKQLDIENLNKMQQIYINLNPPNGDDIDSWMIEHCLSLVSSLATGADKKEVWKQVNDIVRHIRIPVLWNLLLQNRIAINEQLFDIVNENEQNFDQSVVKKRDYELANLWSKHIGIECDFQCHKIACRKYQNNVIQYIEMIEEKYKDQFPEFTEWLTLMLENKKLEVTHTNLQNEVRDLKNYVATETESSQNYTELMEVCNRLKDQVKSNIQHLGKSMQILKSAPSFIIETRNVLNLALQNLQSLDVKYGWINSDLKTELMIFHDNFDINATRKISLKGDIADYRHFSTCISEASTSLVVPVNHDKSSSFPMIRSPIYQLMDCFKAFNIKEKLQEEINLLQDRFYQLNFMQFDSKDKVSSEVSISQLMSILEDVNITSDKAIENIQENYHIMDHWANQTVEKAALNTLDDVKVNGATLKEWKHRYEMLIYMIEHSL